LVFCHIPFHFCPFFRHFLCKERKRTSYAKGPYPIKSKPYQQKDFEKGKIPTQQKDISKTQLEKSRLTNQAQNPIYTNPLFRWLVGGLILGALLSLLLGHGFQVGAPGLLEIGLLALLGYFALRFILNSLRRHES
jgi:hypothetical protein